MTKILPILLLLLTLCEYSCKKTDDVFYNKDDLTKKAGAQKNEISNKLRVALKYNTEYVVPYEWLTLQLGRFKDKLTLALLSEIAQKYPHYKSAPYIYGLARQGEDGKKYLLALKQQDIDFGPDAESVTYLEGGDGGYRSKKLSEAIDDYLSYTQETNIMAVPLNITDTLRVFYKRYCDRRYYLRDFIDGALIEIVEEWEKPYLGNIPDYTKYFVIMPYPNNIFDNTTMNSVIDALASKNSEKQFIGAIITSYWGLDIGCEVLLSEIAQNHTKCLKCASALVALGYIRFGANRMEIIKILEKCLKKATNEPYRDLILYSILTLQTDERDYIIVNEYKKTKNKGKAQILLLGSLADTCGLRTEDFWQECLKAGYDDDIISIRNIAKIALGRIETIKKYMKISPELGELFRTYCTGDDVPIK